MGSFCQIPQQTISVLAPSGLLIESMFLEMPLGALRGGYPNTPPPVTDSLQGFHSLAYNSEREREKRTQQMSKGHVGVLSYQSDLSAQ